MASDSRLKKEFIKRILAWFPANKRKFPWRNARDPFKILVAEILLQKTDATKVSAVYKSFIKKYPTPASLARADLKEIEREIRLLGIHKRATRLKELGKTILKKYNNKIPGEKELLLKLPGIGDYISSAVMCFGFGKDVPVLDTNTTRVLHRVFSIGKESPELRRDKTLIKFAEELVLRDKGKEFNLALIDFAAKVCTKKKPKCKICILNDLCDNRKMILAENLFCFSK